MCGLCTVTAPVPQKRPCKTQKRLECPAVLFSSLESSVYFMCYGRHMNFKKFKTYKKWLGTNICINNRLRSKIVYYIAGYNGSTLTGHHGNEESKNHHLGLHKQSI